MADPQKFDPWQEFTQPEKPVVAKPSTPRIFKKSQPATYDAFSDFVKASEKRGETLPPGQAPIDPIANAKAMEEFKAAHADDNKASTAVPIQSPANITSPVIAAPQLGQPPFSLAGQPAQTTGGQGFSLNPNPTIPTPATAKLKIPAPSPVMPTEESVKTHAAEIARASAALDAQAAKLDADRKKLEAFAGDPKIHARAIEQFNELVDEHTKNRKALDQSNGYLQKDIQILNKSRESPKHENLTSDELALASSGGLALVAAGEAAKGLARKSGEEFQHAAETPLISPQTITEYLTKIPGGGGSWTPGEIDKFINDPRIPKTALQAFTLGTAESAGRILSGYTSPEQLALQFGLGKVGSLFAQTAKDAKVADTAINELNELYNAGIKSGPEVATAYQKARTALLAYKDSYNAAQVARIVSGGVGAGFATEGVKNFNKAQTLEDKLNAAAQVAFGAAGAAGALKVSPELPEILRQPPKEGLGVEFTPPKQVGTEPRPPSKPKAPIAELPEETSPIGRPVKPKAEPQATQPSTASSVPTSAPAASTPAFSPETAAPVGTEPESIERINSHVSSLLELPSLPRQEREILHGLSQRLHEEMESGGKGAVVSRKEAESQLSVVLQSLAEKGIDTEGTVQQVRGTKGTEPSPGLQQPATGGQIVPSVPSDRAPIGTRGTSKRRLDLATRHEITDFMNGPVGYSRDEAVYAIAQTRMVGDREPTKDEKETLEAIVRGEAPMPPKPQPGEKLSNTIKTEARASEPQAISSVEPTDEVRIADLLRKSGRSPYKGKNTSWAAQQLGVVERPGMASSVLLEYQKEDRRLELEGKGEEKRNFAALPKEEQQRITDEELSRLDAEEAKKQKEEEAWHENASNGKLDDDLFKSTESMEKSADGFKFPNYMQEAFVRAAEKSGWKEVNRDVSGVANSYYSTFERGDDRIKVRFSDHEDKEVKLSDYKGHEKSNYSIDPSPETGYSARKVLDLMARRRTTTTPEPKSVVSPEKPSEVPAVKPGLPVASAEPEKVAEQRTAEGRPTEAPTDFSHKRENLSTPEAKPVSGVPEETPTVPPQGAKPPTPTPEAGSLQPVSGGGQAKPKTPKIFQKGKKDPLAAIREHYKPGNVVWVDYWKKYDKVLDFKVLPDGRWAVNVIESDKDGNPSPGAQPRMHSTAPSRGDRVEKMAPAPASSTETAPQVETFKPAVAVTAETKPPETAPEVAAPSEPHPVSEAPKAKEQEVAPAELPKPAISKLFPKKLRGSAVTDEAYRLALEKIQGRTGYIVPQIRVDVEGKEHLINTSSLIKEAGLEPVPGELNVYRKTSEEPPEVEEVAAMPPIVRTTPAVGTPERAKLEDDVDAADKAHQMDADQETKLEKERQDSKYGSKRYESSGKRLAAAKEKSSKSWDIYDALRKQWVQARLEDAVNQTENPVGRIAAQQYLDEQAYKQRKDYSAKAAREHQEAYDEAKKSLQKELSHLVPEATKGSEEDWVNLSQKDVYDADRKGVESQAQDFLDHPLLAETKAGVLKSLRGRIRGETIALSREKGLAEYEKIEQRIKDAGLISSGDFQSFRKRIYDAHSAQDVVKVLDDARDYAKSQEKRFADKQEADRHDAVKNAKELKPLSELDYSFRSGYFGNKAEPGAFVSDGHMLVLADAIKDKKLQQQASALSKEITTAGIEQKVIKGMWDGKYSDTKARPAEFLGQRDITDGSVAVARPGRTKEVGYFVPIGKNEPLVAVDANKLKTLERMTGYDAVRVTKETEPVHFYRAGKRIAIVMPVRSGDIDVPTARQAKTTNRAVPPGPGGQTATSPKEVSDKPTLRGSVLGMDVAAQAARIAVEKNVLPILKNANVSLHEILAIAKNWITPRFGVPTDALDAVMRLIGDRAKAQYLMQETMAGIKKAFSEMPQEDQVDFIDRYKAGEEQVTPELETVAEMYRKSDEERYALKQQYRESLPHKEDHFRVFWKVIPGSQGEKVKLSPGQKVRWKDANNEEWIEGTVQSVNNAAKKVTVKPKDGEPLTLDRNQVFKAGGLGAILGRRPLQGSMGWAKKSTLASISEGLLMGGEPFTYNPQELFEMSVADDMKFITAQEMWSQIGDLGYRKFVREGQAPPEGYARLDDRLARVYFPATVTPKGAKKGFETAYKSGEWYVEENVHRILKNHLSHDLIREKQFGRSLMALKNLTTGIELSLSPFHFFFETYEAMSSEMGLGFSRAWNLGLREARLSELPRALKQIIASPFAPVRFAMTGSAIRSFMKSQASLMPTKDEDVYVPSPEVKERYAKLLREYPYIYDIVTSYFRAGGNLRQHAGMRLQATEGFKQALANEDYLGAIARAFPAFTQLIMKPLFDIYIPNLKVALYARLRASLMEEHADDLGSGKMTQGELDRMALDSVENRFGEMNFDKLFWNRTFKTGLQGLFRSVTWKFGNIGEFSGAAIGQGKEVGKSLGLIGSGGGGTKPPGGSQGSGGSEPPESGDSAAYKQSNFMRIPKLDHRMAWGLGLVITTAVLSEILQYIATGFYNEKKTGKWEPQHVRNWKDVIDPRIGGVDNRGKPNRVQPPTYIRDLLHLIKSPVGYIRSSLSGIIIRSLEALANQNYQHVRITEPEDSYLVKEAKRVGHIFALPFAVQQAWDSKQRGGSKAATIAGFLGFSRAPRDMDFTPAEEMAVGFLQSTGDFGTRSPEQARVQQDVANLIAYGKSEDKRAAIAKIRGMEKRGTLTKRKADLAIKKINSSWLQQLEQRLTLPEKFDVYDVASPEEKAQLWPVIVPETRQGQLARLRQISELPKGVRQRIALRWNEIIKQRPGETPAPEEEAPETEPETRQPKGIYRLFPGAQRQPPAPAESGMER